MKVKGFWPKIITPKPALYLFSESLGALFRHSQAQNVFRSILNLSTKCTAEQKPTVFAHYIIMHVIKQSYTY